MQSKFSHLVMATKVPRGYIHETVEAQSRKISNIVDSVTGDTLALKTAMKARMIASYEFRNLFAPLIRIYGKLSACYLRNQPFPSHVIKRLETSLKPLRKKMAVIYKPVIETYSVLPSWTEAREARAKHIIFEMLQDTDVLINSFHSLVRKPTLGNIRKTRSALCYGYMGSLFDLGSEIDREVKARALDQRPAAETLAALRSHLAADSAMIYTRQWSYRYFARQAAAEMLYFSDSSQLKRNRNLAALLGSLVFANAQLFDNASQAIKYPGMNWYVGEFPGDEAMYFKICGALKKLEILHDRFNDAISGWVQWVEKCFQKIDKPDIPHLRRVIERATELLEIVEAFIDGENEVFTSRKEFEVVGRDYLCF